MKSLTIAFIVMSAAALAAENPDPAFFVVDGRELKASFVRDTVGISAKVMELSGRKLDDKLFPRWANSTAMKIAPGLLTGMLVDAEIERRGVTATPESDAATLARYNSMTRSKAVTLDDLAPRFGALEDAFRAQFHRESRFTAFLAAEKAGEVSDAEIDSFLVDATNIVEECRRIDEAAKIKINAAWERLNSGESWESVATNVTEDALLDPSLAECWKSWQTVNLQKLDSLDMALELRQLKEGGYTRPLEVEDGFTIVRINKIEGKTYDLARIIVRRASEYTMPSRDEAKLIVKRIKTTNFQLSLLESLKARAKIEYPLGTNFTYKIWK